MRPAQLIRRLGLLGLSAAVLAVPVAAAGTPTPPEGVRTQIENPTLLLAMPADGGAWTLWSGTLEGDLWWMLSRPHAQTLGGGPCPVKPVVLTICFSGGFGPDRSVVVGRVKPRAASVEAVDAAGRPLRTVRQGAAYLSVAQGTPSKVNVRARDRRGRVIARLVVRYP